MGEGAGQRDFTHAHLSGQGRDSDCAVQLEQTRRTPRQSLWRAERQQPVCHRIGAALCFARQQIVDLRRQCADSLFEGSQSGAGQCSGRLAAQDVGNLRPHPAGNVAEQGKARAFRHLGGVNIRP